MPNWCSNKIEVSGKDLQVFRESLRTVVSLEVFGFSQLYPEPNYDDEKQDEDEIMPTWWNWRNDNWGTKWEPRDCVVEVMDKSITINFSTAWSPPFQWAEYVTKNYDLKIIVYFLESGIGLCGSRTIIDGEAKSGTGLSIEYDGDSDEPIPDSPFEKFMKRHNFLDTSF